MILVFCEHFDRLWHASFYFASIRLTSDEFWPASVNHLATLGGLKKS